MSRRTAIRYTYEDYLSIPEGTPGRHEIVGGELFVTAAPRFRHQEVVANVLETLRQLARMHRLGKAVAGPVTVHIHAELVLEPDIVFVGADRLDIVDREGDIHGPPDLVVEVLSPSNRDYDRTLKRKHYLENGVAELWIVDADASTIEVWRAGSTEPEVAREPFVWAVGEHRLPIALDDVFRE